MTRTEYEKSEWDLQAYGCRAIAIDNAIKNYQDPLMLAASMLSDAQLYKRLVGHHRSPCKNL